MAGDPAASGVVAGRAVAADRCVLERQRRVAVGTDAATAVASSSPVVRPPVMVRCCSTTSVSRPCTRSTRLAWFGIDGDAGAAVDGDVGVDRQLAAGEDDGLPLHRGRELDPVGGQAVGIRERQRLAQGQHAVVGRDVARGRDDEGRTDRRRARGRTGPARRRRCRGSCPPGGPGDAALVGRRGRGRIGPAQRRVVGRVAQGDGLGRPAIVRRARPRTAGSAGTFSRSLGALPSTSLPKMLSPLLAAMRARDVGVDAAGGGVARDDAVAYRPSSEIPPPRRRTRRLLPLTVLLRSRRRVLDPAACSRAVVRR